MEVKKLTSMNEFEKEKEQSRGGQLLLFKYSMRCPISLAAQREFEAFVQSAETENGEELFFAKVDVVANRTTARALADNVRVEHQSPQVILFRGGEVFRHASHGAITRSALLNMCSA